MSRLYVCAHLQRGAKGRGDKQRAALVPVPAYWDNWSRRARSRASPARLELQLLLGGAEGVLHLVLGEGFPLARVFPEEVVPDDGHLAGEAELEGGSTGTGRGQEGSWPRGQGAE